MNILILDDHPLARLGIITTFSGLNDIKTFEASNISHAINYILNSNIDLAIVDLNLGKESGLEFIKKARELNPYIKYIIVTSSMKKDDYKRAQELNVDGYILKEAFIEDIIYAIGVVNKGRKYIDPEIMQYTANTQPYLQLTSREYDIMLEVAKGLSNSDIAKKLFISEYTVKKHISSILSKLELTNRTEIALYATGIMSFSYDPV